MTLMMTSAQVVETSVNVPTNSPSRDYSHPYDQTTQTTETSGFRDMLVKAIRLFQAVPFKQHYFPKDFSLTLAP